MPSKQKKAVVKTHSVDAVRAAMKGSGSMERVTDLSSSLEEATTPSSTLEAATTPVYSIEDIFK